jgi:hypothetical protein
MAKQSPPRLRRCLRFPRLIGGSVWWFGYSQHRDIQQISADDRRITKSKIRAQLLESVERTRQAALAEAEKAENWKERERLRQAAEKGLCRKRLPH